MLIGLRIFFGLLTMVIGIYSFSIDDFSLIPYMQLSLALMFIVMGISEIKEQRKSMGILFLCVAIFVFFVVFVKMFR